jgi:hypothetical protein
MTQAKDTRTSALEAFRIGAANLFDRWRYFNARRPSIQETLRTPEIESAVNGLRTHGCAVFPNYYSAELCKVLCEGIDWIISNQPEIIQSDQIGADRRIFGSERASSAIATFNNDPFCLAVGQAYARRKLTAFSTLAGRIEARAGNLGSGQGWHRDAFHFQYKAMLYLTDVDVDHGPFQLIEASHHSVHMFADTIRGRLPRSPRSRVTDGQAQELLAATPHRLKTFCKSAGTLILFDSSTIHRGAPLKAGVRYALTNYYYEPEFITPEFAKNFEPFAYAPSG